MGISASLGSSALLPAGLGFRNKIINGGFDVWQRSTDATTVGADQYSAMDRWRTRTASGGGSLKASRQLSGLAGTTYCARIQRTSGNTNTGSLQIAQTFETIHSIPLAGQPVSFSFYARKGADYSPSSSLLKAAVVTGTGTDQYWLSFTGGAVLIDQSVTLTTSWQRFTFTAIVSPAATQLYIVFEMNPTGTAGANDYYEITGVQLEQNNQPTPFEQRPIGVELQLCQRYFVRFTNIGQWYSVGQVIPTNGAYYMLKLPVRMRTGPTGITASGTFITIDSGGVGRGITISFGSGDPDFLGLTGSGSFNLTNGAATLMFGQGTTSIDVNGVEL